MFTEEVGESLSGTADSTDERLPDAYSRTVSEIALEALRRSERRSVSLTAEERQPAKP